MEQANEKWRFQRREWQAKTRINVSGARVKTLGEVNQGSKAAGRHLKLHHIKSLATPHWTRIPAVFNHCNV